MALKAKIAAASNNLEITLDAHQKILSPLEQIQMRQQTMEERERSLNLIIDSEGRTIDKRTGEVVQLQSRMPTLKANIKAQKRDYDQRERKATDLFASGIASTMSGIASVFNKLVPAQPEPTPAAALNAEAQSELFFDPRLKFFYFFLYSQNLFF